MPQSKPRRTSSLTDAQRQELRLYRERLIADARSLAAGWYCEDVMGLLFAHTWTFAKTMAHNPHFWTTRADWQYGAENFQAVVQYIRDHGRTMRFGRYDYTVWDLNGWRYWTMGDHLDRTTIINRAKNTGDYATADVGRTCGDGTTGGTVRGAPDDYNP